ncbi:MAG: HAMP domain-containing histidine kinase [Anaerolineae bacterium]|nr:HAMP domain-containing histidine kinase [Anaerolineae bacterium]
MNMRSLVFKLTLAFVFVGVSGALLVALVIGLRTRQEFGRFIENQSHQGIATTLADFYTQNGGWQNFYEAAESDPVWRGLMVRVVVVDNAGVVVFGLGPENDGRAYPYDDLDKGLPIEVDGETVGTVLMRPDQPGDGYGSGAPPSRGSPENTFLSNVTIATITSAVIAGLIALILGILLARTLTRPIRALTAATHAMAAGNLGQQVEVHSRDEIGELADSFNQMSRDLAQASQQRKQMTADIAHDLRTPLSVLRGYTEGLRAGSLDGSPDLYTIMHEEVIHLQHLVEDLRTLSLADAGELPLHRRAVDPRALLERTGLAYVMQAEAKGVTLRIDAPDNLPSVNVDVERMTQVLNNLVANALRYTDAGEIVLAAGVGEQQVVLQVKDTGVGIPAEELPYIFNRFYRADKARQRVPEGNSGLGLAIAKAIVVAHGGGVTAVSTPGQGTTFFITLPV